MKITIEDTTEFTNHVDIAYIIDGDAHITNVQVEKDHLYGYIVDNDMHEWCEDYAGWDGEHRQREGYTPVDEYLTDNLSRVCELYVTDMMDIEI